MGLCSSCLPEGRLKRERDWQPVDLAGDWPIARPEDLGIPTAAIEAAFDDVFSQHRLPNIRSLLIARSGYLIAEGYAVDRNDRTRPGALMSATKSIVSMLAGVARDRGYLASLDITTADLFPEYQLEGQIATITLRNALTMRSGIKYSNDDFSLDMEWGDIDDSIAHILHKPMAFTPGTHFDYTDACAHLAGAMISRAAGKSLRQIADESLFREAGIIDYDWLTHRDGRCFGAYGLFVTPRDFLRIAEQGLRAWRGESEVLSAQWMHESTSFQVQPDFGDGYTYGYFWWLDPASNAFTAHGHGGQFAYVMPDLDIAIAITADPNSNEDLVSVRARDVHRIAQILRSSVLFR